MKNKKMFLNWFVLFFTIVSLTAGILFTNKSAEAGKCVSLCNQHFLGGCHGSQPNYAAAAVSTRGTCIVRLNNIPETDFNTIIANMSCDSSNNDQTCLPEFCPTSGFGLSDSNSFCQVYYDLTGSNNAECKDSITIKGDTWDNVRHECIECSGNQGYVWGTSAGIAYTTPSLVFKEVCGAAAICDGKTVGGACGAGVCDKDGACCLPPNILDAGNNCVAAAVCNNDGTCDAPGETTANCPNDCCTKTACGAGCTNAADCMTIEPDCAGFCMPAFLGCDPDCGISWECDGAGFAAECPLGGALEVCNGLNGDLCPGGTWQNCDLGCNPVCDNFGAGAGCGFIPFGSCTTEYDACDCVCAIVVCNNNSVQDNGETGIDCGGGGCPACAACTPNGCGGGCPAGCTGADDPDCAGACLIPLCGTDLDCCTNTPCVAPQVCNTTSGACVDCLTSADCAAGEVCDSGSCIPCSGEGVAETDPLLCCSGLNIIDGVCTSACDPNASFFCNPLRQSVETLVEGGEKMIGYILGLIGSVALLLVIIAGIMYMTSAGNEEKIASSKKILTGAVIGLGIALLAFSLLQVVLSVLNM